MILGLPAVIPMLIGGAIGGALPDIDIKGSAIEKLGKKSGGAMKKTIGKLGRGGRTAAKLTEVIGIAFDKIFLSPIAKLWRWFAEKVLGKVYHKIYGLGAFGKERKSLGQILRWSDESKPWDHRGGITHSFSFMITGMLLFGPIALLLQSPAFLFGCWAGIVSHLVADSFCKSGTKFFFPWAPKIGFKNDSGAGRGRDVRLLPKGLQVVTGKAQITNAELENYPDYDQAKKDRKLRNRERRWQHIFQLGAIAVCVALFMGVSGKGGISFGMDGEGIGSNIVNSANNGGEQKQPQGNNNSDANADNATQLQQASPSNNAQQSSQPNQTQQPNQAQSNAADNNTASAVSSNTGAATMAAGSFASVAEKAGPASLTHGDLAVKDLPRGVMKMPDESLWIIGVGDVTKENLNNPKWTFTEDEKAKLLAAAANQQKRAVKSDIVSDAANAANNAANAVGNAAGNAANAVSGAANNIANASGNSGTGASSGGSFWDALFGGGSNGGYKGGFLGITPWTSSG